MKQQRFFITGTDTDCGKTYVSCQLLDYFSKENYKAQALKPIASGGDEDIRSLMQHNHDSSININYKKYLPPISPHIAAKHANDFVNLEELKNFCSGDEFSGFDYLLIEGAGGIAVPLNMEETWINFLQIMPIPVIIVVAIRLGCINHALLTDFYLKQQNIRVAGWIANCIDDKTLEVDEIISTLSEKMHAPLLTTLNYCGKITSKLFEEEFNANI